MLELGSWERVFQESVGSELKRFLQHGLTKKLVDYPGEYNDVSTYHSPACLSARIIWHEL